MSGRLRRAVALLAVAAGLASAWLVVTQALAAAPTATPRPSVTGTPPAGATPQPTPLAPAACAFPGATPQTYETGEDRQLYLWAADLAGYNMLWPGDPFFSTQGVEVGPRAARSVGPVYVPPTLLKAIAWIESAMTQGAGSTAWGTTGPALVSFDCGYGIMQVTSGMTVPLGQDGRASEEQALVAQHFAYNTARGSVMLAEKWNAAPAYRPIAGIDTNSDPHIVENWYFAIWSYNGFTGPGANRSNHPLDPIYGAWPRTPYSCGPANDGFSHNRGQFPYQELVAGCASRPPVVQGHPLWTPLPFTLPDLSNPAYRNPLALANFVSPYSGMDIPSPAPWHNDTVPQPDLLLRLVDLGMSWMDVNQRMIRFDISPEGVPNAPFNLEVYNTGSGLIPWRVSSSVPWLTVSTPYGVSMGSDLYCNGCNRATDVTLAIDPSKVPQGFSSAVVSVEWLGTPFRIDIPVFVFQTLRIGVPGIARN